MVFTHSQFQLTNFFTTFLSNNLCFNVVIIQISSLFFISLVILYLVKSGRKPGVFLIDHSCYKPDDNLKCSHEHFIERSALTNLFSKESLQFQKSILEKSGLGQSTYFPRAMHELPPNLSVAAAVNETETAMFGAIDKLLSKTGWTANQIGIIISNSSLFNPTPSLCSMIINHYKMNSNVLSYSLAGMGCSAGLISISLAKQLLQVHPDTYALVVSTENITKNWYHGNTRSMLVTNCLFRMGAGAILLSNCPSDCNRAKYQLIHTIRSHHANEDHGYRCAYQEEDALGKVGVSLSKDLASVAGEALKSNFVTLAPLVLPLSEQLRYLAYLVGRKVLKMAIKTYMPDFKKAFDHFCIHAGGRAVLDKVESSLELTKQHLEPSRMTLHRFGNTSSSSLWYELSYLEAKRRIKKGDKVCQIAFGSGFKCNSAVWHALKGIDPSEETNPWINDIDILSPLLK